MLQLEHKIYGTYSTVSTPVIEKINRNFAANVNQYESIICLLAQHIIMLQELGWKAKHRSNPLSEGANNLQHKLHNIIESIVKESCYLSVHYNSNKVITIILESSAVGFSTQFLIRIPREE